MARIKPYSENKECPKCGGVISILFYNGVEELAKAKVDGSLQPWGDDYLIKTCSTCKHQWKEHPKDYLDIESLKGVNKRSITD